MSHPSICIRTLGCAKNEVDSDKMKARLLGAGYRFTDEPEECDLCIVNTCAFLSVAVEEGLDVIFDILNMQSGTPSKLVVCGCMPSRYGEELAAELPEVATFVPADKEDEIVSVVDELLGVESASNNNSMRTENLPYAYVKISDGCNRFCSYCMIPYIRGRYRSFSLGSILEEVDELAKKGTREIIFIGQDTGIWGSDFTPKSSITALLETAATRYPNVWFRILYIQPEGITDELLELIARTDNICSYLDIPLQHVNADLLHAMNRRGSADELASLVSHIREIVPGVCIRTTLMTGFPGETDEQAQEVVDFVQNTEFDFAGVFAYSQEEGSSAAQFDNQIDEEVKIERAQTLLDTCDSIGFARCADMIGAELEVIIEGYEQTSAGLEALARSQYQAPEVDGQVHVPMIDGQCLRIGEKIPVRITESFCYEQIGEIVTCKNR